MQGDIASMIDAMYSRDATMKLNQQAIEAGQSQQATQNAMGWGSLGVNAAGMALAIPTGGASIPAAAMLSNYGANQFSGANASGSVGYGR